MDYLALCERLWRGWANGGGANLAEWESTADSLELSLEHCPEPYLIHSAGTKSLVFLTTNPGGGMVFQQRSRMPPAVLNGSYSEMAGTLPKIYHGQRHGVPGAAQWKGIEEAIGGSARNRLEKMAHLAALLGYDGFLQVEMIPLHSKSLPNKARAAMLASSGPLSEYLDTLGAFLGDYILA